MKNYFTIFLLTIILIVSCNKENNESANTEKEFDLIGKAQKGPFINGTDIYIYELDKKYTPTGRSFHTNTDEKGNFELKGIKLNSAYVELLADGFYYNEVVGNISNEKLSLKAIVDISEPKNVNINVLTNLEYDRVKYLIQNQKISLKEAKIKAQKELLKVFNIDSVQISNPENLDIIKTGEGDAVLLAISAILQSNRTTGELSKLLADIVIDMKEDGELNDTLLKKIMVSYASILNLDKVGLNLVAKYKELGIIVENINDFDKYVTNFIKDSNFPIISPFEFPVSTSIGKNLLVPELTKIQLNNYYSLAVKMPSIGKLMIRIKRTGGTGLWWYSSSQVYGWKVSNYNLAKNEQTFTSTVNGDILDLPIQFTESGNAIVEYYYNESTRPSFTKTISWGSFENSDYQFLDESPAGRNILAKNNNSTLFSDTSYVFSVYHDGSYEVNFKLHIPDDMTVQVLDGWGDYSWDLNTNELDFKLKGTSSICEIIVKFKGIGQIDLESDLQFKDGTLLKRTYFLK